MAAKAEKVMVLGIDAPIVPRLVALAREGKLPALGRLLAEGVYAPNCLAPFPTITPPNWTTITTGAWPGTHGLTDFDGFEPGDPLDKTHQNFDSREVKAERLWEAAARAGKRTILVNYPVTWNANNPDGWRLGGNGLHINDIRLGVDRRLFNLNNLCQHFLLSTEPYPFANEVSFKRASDWEGVEHSPRALEAEVSVRPVKPATPMPPFTWHLLVDAAEGKGYDTVVVAKAKNKQGVYARLKVGEWSGHIYDTFPTEAGPKEAVFRMKLLELSPDASQFRLFVPGIGALHGWAEPAELEEEIKSAEGLPLVRPPFDAWVMEWIDAQTLVEANDLHNRWLADASHYLLTNKPWDLFFIHVHSPDGLYHAISADLEPTSTRSRELQAELTAAETALYQSVDRCLGRILEAADEKTLVFAVSDHGAKPKGRHFQVQEVLEAAGLLAYKPGEPGERRQIDWSRTQAAGQRTVHVYVNLKGRDPEGTVPPGEEYERVRERTIKALLEWNDPETGLKPVVLALKREDARVLGHYDERSGDIIYAVDPRFYEEHGIHLPTAKFGIGDLHSLFIMAGPGVKKGEVVERTVWLTDVVPTACYLADLPVPAQCEGSVVYQALEDPDARVKELQSLRRNVERLKRMVERPPMC
ncbi:MAG: alkaline phosphatase family protein [Chloroflexi bacterium]|nr:alkaline phosphatase family protein [Chloroflexota bacterium]